MTLDQTGQPQPLPRSFAATLRICARRRMCLPELRVPDEPLAVYPYPTPKNAVAFSGRFSAQALRLYCLALDAPAEKRVLFSSATHPMLGTA